jgi:hypothetical protein
MTLYTPNNEKGFNIMVLNITFFIVELNIHAPYFSNSNSQQ